jgi:O-antigen/teichoic acid export membrane protein
MSSLASVSKPLGSGYLLLISRIGAGLVTYRLIYQYLSDDAGNVELGLYALLWTFLGFGALLDFGFAVTVQKRVAQAEDGDSWLDINRCVSSISIVYTALALVLVGLAWLLPDRFLDLFASVPRGRYPDLRFGVSVFFTGMALNFPLQIFPEILKGKQRLVLNNLLGLAGVFVNLVGVILAVRYDIGFGGLMLVTMSSLLLPPLCAGLIAKRLCPQLRISPGLFCWRELRHTLSFSLIVYMITVSYMLMTQTATLITGMAISMAAVAILNPGTRVAAYFAMLLRQLSRVLQPMAARLYGQRDQDAVARLLRFGLRATVLLGLPSYLLLAFHLAPALRILTGEETPSPEMLLSGQLLLLWTFSYTLTHTTFKQMSVMGGHERRLLWVGIVEALLNIVLTLGLALSTGNVAGVALGTLLPSLLLGWGLLWGWAARECSISRRQLFAHCFGRMLPALLPGLGLLLLTRQFGLQTAQVSLPALALSGGASALVLALGIWFLGLRSEEQQACRRLLIRTHASDPHETKCRS